MFFLFKLKLKIFWKPIFILTWMNPQNTDIHVEALKLL